MEAARQYRRKPVKNSRQTWQLFPKFPTAELIETVETYTSSVDPTFSLKVRTYRPDVPSRLPTFMTIHGWEQVATDVGETFMRRMARAGFFVMGVEMRGSSGSGGNSGSRDAGGRETMDIKDAQAYIETLYADKIYPGVRYIFGMSGGGNAALNAVVKFPYYWAGLVCYFPVTSLSAWHGEQTPGSARQLSIELYVGGANGNTPALYPDEYKSRNVRDFISNIKIFSWFFVDKDDASVNVSHTRAMESAYLAAARTDYEIHESQPGSPYRYYHGSPDMFPDLINAESFYFEQIKAKRAAVQPDTGTLHVAGWLITPKFTINLAVVGGPDAGKTRYATVTYNYGSNSYTLTPIVAVSGGYLLATIITDTGLVASAVLDNASGATVLTPVAPTIGGFTIENRLKVIASSINKDGSNNVNVLADMLGGNLRLGYALKNTGSNRPTYNATGLNSTPTIGIVAASNQYLEGLRMKALAGKTKVTIITVMSGTIFNMGSGALNQLQLAFTGGQYYAANSNGGNAFGNYAGTAVFKVRVMTIDGTLAAGSRVKMREDKVTKTLSVTGTFPITTSDNGTEIVRLGRRSYDTLGFDGNFKDIIVIPDLALSDADADTIADILKAEYAI